MKLRPLVLLTASFFGGCMFQNVSTATRFRDAVDGVNEEARWNRMDLATQRVHPEYRADYALTRYQWGRAIQIADTEVVSLQLGEGEEAATSTVAISWYSLQTMTLHTTVIRQRWEQIGGTFTLREEEVLDGNPRLIEPPEPPANEEAEG
ncbi:MAG: hypothetical protein AAGF12_13090 [Myxococcota bacterium]